MGEAPHLGCAAAERFAFKNPSWCITYFICLTVLRDSILANFRETDRQDGDDQKDNQPAARGRDLDADSARGYF
jgi:hypothetical protein